jgi:hypothetical protein
LEYVTGLSYDILGDDEEVETDMENNATFLEENRGMNDSKCAV